MKRIFVLLLALTLVLALVSCNEDQKQQEATTETETVETIEDAGQAASVAKDHNPDQVEEKIAVLKDQNGFFIRLEIAASSGDGGETDSETLIYGANNNLYYIASSETEEYFDLSSETGADLYTKEDGEWKKTTVPYVDGIDKDQLRATMEGYMTAIIGYMTMYDFYSSYPMQKTSATVAGRACDQYSFSFSYPGVGSLSYSFCVDRETDICLKWEASGSADGESGSGSFECKEFRTDYTVVLPTISE